MAARPLQHPGCGTNWGSEVDLFAPAVDILGAMADSTHSWACIGTGTSSPPRWR